jgi:hypothetical protein
LSTARPGVPVEVRAADVGWSDVAIRPEVPGWPGEPGQNGRSCAAVRHGGSLRVPGYSQRSTILWRTGPSPGTWPFNNCCGQSNEVRVRVRRSAWVGIRSFGSGLILPMTGRGFLGGRRSLGGGPLRGCCLRRLGMCCGCLPLCGLPWPGGLIPGSMLGGRWRTLTCLSKLGICTRTRWCGGFLGRCRLTFGCGRLGLRLMGLTRGFRRFGGGMRTGSLIIRRLRIPCDGMTRCGIPGLLILG